MRPPRIPLSDADLAVIRDLSTKAEADALAAVQLTLKIAPIEAKPAIVFHVAFTVLSLAAHFVERVRMTAGNRSEMYPAAGEPDPSYLATFRALCEAFGRYPDTAAIDRALAEILAGTGVTVKQAGGEQ